MSEENKTGIPSLEESQKYWFRPVNRLGRITMIFAMVLCYVPVGYLYFRYGQLPDIGTIAVGMISVTLAFGPAWFLEPVSYFPALGTAGSYIGILAGSMGQMRVPAALVAKSVAEVKDNTQEAEIVATAGIIGSVILNTVILLIVAIAGSYLLAFLPKTVMATLSAYVLPAIMGAVLAMFSGGSKIRISMMSMLAGLILAWVVGSAVAAGRAKGMNIPAWIPLLQMPVCLVLAVAFSRLHYNRERAAEKNNRVVQ